MKVALGIVALLIVVGAREWIQEAFVTTITTAAKGGQSACVQMLGSTSSEEDGRTFIVGNVRSNCERSVSSVTLVFKVDNGRDSEGVAYAYARDLKPGETRRFKSAVTIPKGGTFRFDRINAF